MLNVRKPPQIFLNSPGFPFKLYIIFSFARHDANSSVHLADVGGCSSFHCIAIHLLAMMRAILINLSLFLLTFIMEVSPNRIILGSVGMVVPMMSLSSLTIEIQDVFRHGQDQNICISVPVPVLHLGQNSEY